MKTNNKFTIHFGKYSLNVSSKDYAKFNGTKGKKAYKAFCDKMLDKYVKGVELQNLYD